jgi:uncharacterized protein with PIN domain
VAEVTLRFYAELNDFLPPLRRHAAFAVRVDGPTAVKDLIEAAGVPHPEVGLIVIDGEVGDFSARIRGGERVAVYPLFRRLPLDELGRRLRPPLEGPIRFLADTHLGRLAGYLRLAGFDTAYRNDFADREAAELSAREGRVLLTRDQGLLKRSAVQHGYWVRATSPRQQFHEVVARFDLAGRFAPFSRCRRCNAVLVAVGKAAVRGRVPPRVWAAFDEFAQCPGCGRFYWAGSHTERVRRWLEGMSRGGRDEPGG